MRWDEDEITELQDNYLEREIAAYKHGYDEEFELIFKLFRTEKYEEAIPGITNLDEAKARRDLEPLFYRCFNRMVTRCFGWGLPNTCMVPFADCINHANVDSNYELICSELHRTLIQCKKN